MNFNKELRKEKYALCHVLVRTAGGVDIFSDQEDALRFVFQMHAANIGRPAANLYRKETGFISERLLSGEDIPAGYIQNGHRGFLVKIGSFALVKDHVHFLLSANIQNGIPDFIGRLNLGFAKYYNNKHKKQGILFDRPYKIAKVSNNLQADAAVFYINIKSALEALNLDWSKSKSEDFMERISGYKFSSFPDLFLSRNSRITSAKAVADYGVKKQNLAKYAGLISAGNLEKIKFEKELFLE